MLDACEVKQRNMLVLEFRKIKYALIKMMIVQCKLSFGFKLVEEWFASYDIYLDI